MADPVAHEFYLKVESGPIFRKSIGVQDVVFRAVCIEKDFVSTAMGKRPASVAGRVHAERMRNG